MSDSSKRPETAHSLFRQGVTLVEVLIVIAIIGMLVQLLLPAVQAARESARRTHCLNNLRQLGLGVAGHQAATGRFPTGGWGYRWMGDPDRGNDRRQPGGWIFNLLPYIGEEVLHQRARDQADGDLVRAEVQATVLPIFNCPSRRGLGPFRNAKTFPLINAPDAVKHARTDYAINGGDFPWNASVDIESYAQFDEQRGSFNYPYGDARLLSGICFRGSEIRPKDVTDGLSKCYLLGEKSMPRLDYETGLHWGDDQSMYIGEDLEHTRWSREVAEERPNLPTPDLDTPPDIRNYAFGSAHQAVFHMIFCDGSAHAISYDIDPPMHQDLGNRADGKIHDLGTL